MLVQLAFAEKLAVGIGFTVTTWVIYDGQGVVCAVKVTVYVPGDGYVNVGFCRMEVSLVSDVTPKSQCHPDAGCD